MSSPQSSGSSASAARLGADGERVSERLGLHRQLLSKLAQSQALTGQDIESAYAQVTELMTTLLRVERGSVWRFDASGSQLECVDLFEWTQRRHTSGAIITQEAMPAYFQALAQNRCIAAHDAATDAAAAWSASFATSTWAAPAAGSSKKSCWRARWPTSWRA